MKTRTDTTACPRCLQRGKTWDGADARCGFDPDGTFIDDNWNCATLNELRDVAERYRPVWSEDQWAAVIPWDGRFVVLGWYKHRGRTEFAWVLDAEFASPLDLDEAESALEFHALAESAARGTR